MDWMKIPIDEVLFSDYTNSELLALIKYQAIYSQLEKEPTKKQLRRFLSQRELNFVLNSYEVCIEIVQKQIQMVQQKRNNEKESYKQKQLLSKNSDGGQSSKRIRSGGSDKTRLDKTRLDKTRLEKEYKEKFVDWYKSYPKKVAKQAALRAFEKATNNGIDIEKLTDGLYRYNSYLAKNPEKKQFIPNPATWLNAGQWDDEYPVSEKDKPFSIEDCPL